MSINKEKDMYLKDGRLDLTILNEALVKPLTQEKDQEDYNSILDDLESIELKDEDISATLREMAMIFEKEDEYKKAFNSDRLEQEKKEFGQKD